MRGSINYLQKISDICKANKGNCKRCPLGNKKVINDNLCPRLTHPETWNAERIVEMVRRIDNVNL